MDDVGGPFLLYAVVCEKVLVEQDGVNSLIRVVDRFTVAKPSAQSDENGQPTALPVLMITLTVAFKSGDAPGSHGIGIQYHSPSGKMGQLTESDFSCSDEEDGGANIIANVLFPTDEEGVCWIDISLDGSRVTRLPLRIVYQQENTDAAQETA